MPDERLFETVGVIHIHSNYSDGTKTIEEIAQIGAAAELDYLMFTDHMTLQPLRDGLQRFHKNVAVIIGYEIEDARNENHYLAFGIESELPAGLNAKEYVDGVREMGGLGIIAHPDEVRNAIPEYPSYPWTEWGAEGFDAIEIWNHMSAWMELLKRINVIKMILTPRRGLRGPTSRVLTKWDQLARFRKLAGIGSADVHAHAYRKGPLKVTIFPYKVQFRSIRTHLLLKEPLSDEFEYAREQIFEAIRSCRLFVSNYRRGEARGFKFYAQRGEMKYHMGEDIPLAPGLEMIMIAPKTASIRIIFNGNVIHRINGKSFRVAITEPGLYRAELLRHNRGWIYTNHLRIRKAEG